MQHARSTLLQTTTNPTTPRLRKYFLVKRSLQFKGYFRFADRLAYFTNNIILWEDEERTLWTHKTRRSGASLYRRLARNIIRVGHTRFIKVLWRNRGWSSIVRHFSWFKVFSGFIQSNVSRYNRVASRARARESSFPAIELTALKRFNHTGFELPSCLDTTVC